MNYVKKIAYMPALKFGISKTSAHFGEFLKIILYTIVLFFVAMAITGLIGYLLNREAIDAAPLIGEKLQAALLQSNMIPAWIAFVVFYFILFYFVTYQETRLSLLIYENRLHEWNGFFSFDASRFSTFFWALTWYMVRVILGFFLLVIPAYYILLKYWFTGISIVDGRTHTVGEDVRFNRDITRGALWNVLGFIIALSFTMALMGALIGLTVGIVIALTLLTTGNAAVVSVLAQMITQILVLFIMPVMFLARTHAYKQLESFIDIQQPRNERLAAQGRLDEEDSGATELE